MFVSAPFSSALIYLLDGMACRYIYLASSCEEYREAGLKHYLVISGMAMTIIRLVFLGTSVVVGLLFSVGSPCRRGTEGFFCVH